MLVSSHVSFLRKSSKIRCKGWKYSLVKPRWLYNDNGNSNTKPLADSIQIDLELESGKISLNLVKRSTEPIKAPLIITELKGQSSIWEDSEDAFLGTYKDVPLGASATVTIKNVDGVKEALYMITMTHDDKAVSLEPCAINEAYKSFGHSDLASFVGDSKNINKKSQFVSVDGVLHSLYETTTSKSRHNLRSEEDNINGTLKEKNFMKRSLRSHLLKRLMTVEIFTIIDDSIFNTLFQLSKATSEIEKKEDAKRSIRYIFTHMMEGLKDVYEGIEHDQVRFTTQWVGALIAETASDVPFVENSIKNGMINYPVALINMEKWVINKVSRQKGEATWPKFDFLATFTSRFMKVVGATSLGSICTSSGVGIISYRSIFRTTKTLAHELTHSLGALHDGESNNCEPRGFIMAERGSDFRTDDYRKPNLLSKCSIEAMVKKVRSLDSVINWNCLRDGDGDFNLGREKDYFLNLLPGQIYDPDDQCRIAYGTKSFHLGGVSPGDEICKWIDCHLGGDQLKTMDGTPCSNGSWCRNSKCVPDNRSPRAPEHCIYGDYKYYVYSGHIDGRPCREEVKLNPNVCVRYKEKCCLSCAINGTTDRGCKDITNECSNIEPRDCYYEYYASACCKTCRALVQNPTDPNCLYGDKGISCSDLVPEICHLSTRFCCQTCAAFVNPNSTTHNNSASLNSTVSSATLSGIFTTTETVSKTATSFSTTASTASIIDPTISPSTNSCIHGDYRGTLEYISVWGSKIGLTCEQLVKHDSSLCYDDAVQKYCCASCSSIQMPKDYCKNGDDKDLLVYLSKNFTCSQLVKYNPRLCEATGNVKNKCCKSCGRFTIRPLKV